MGDGEPCAAGLRGLWCAGSRMRLGQPWCASPTSSKMSCRGRGHATYRMSSCALNSGQQTRIGLGRQEGGTTPNRVLLPNWRDAPARPTIRSVEHAFAEIRRRCGAVIRLAEPAEPVARHPPVCTIADTTGHSAQQDRCTPRPGQAPCEQCPCPPRVHAHALPTLPCSARSRSPSTLDLPAA